VIDSSLESYAATVASTDAIEDLIQSGLFRLSDQTASKVFLKGLMRTRRSLAQDSVGAFRDVLDLNTRHGAIMALLAL
jgi:hypothetical protein